MDTQLPALGAFTNRAAHCAGITYFCGGGNVRSDTCARYEDVWGSGGMAALILDLSAKFSEWSFLCSGRFTRESDPPVPIE